MAKGTAKNVTEKITDKLVKECKEKLLKTKMDLLNRVKEAREKLDLGEKAAMKLTKPCAYWLNKKC